MKPSDVQIGTCYTCKVTHKLVIVEILSTHPNGGWNAKNLSTGKTIHIKSAQRLRGVAKGSNTSPTVATKASVPSRRANKRKSTHTSKPVAHKRLSALDAAAKVLTETDEPLNCRQMIEIMISRNYWQPINAGKTPQNTLHAAISKEIKTKGKESRFKKASRGIFTLAQ